MKKLILCLLVIFNLSVQGQKESNALEIPQSIANKVTKYLSSEYFEEVHKLFSPEMQEHLSVEQLKSTFSGIKAQYGTIQKGLEFKSKKTAEAIYYEKGIAFEKEKFTLIFSLNKENKINRFRLSTYSPNYKWSAPKYSTTENVTEKETIIESELPLMGKLTIPADNKYETLIVFVHGSGPNDMDESLGPNKLFKDLAYGLASNNIASLRYNKVSYDYPSTLAKKMNQITIEKLVVNDAVQAIKKAKALGVKKVLLLGHSLGGHMAPMIAGKEPVDGVILMAGNVSQLHELLIPQYEHIMKNDPTTSIGEFQLNAIKVQVKNIQENTYNASTPSMALPLGLPASFWLSLKDYYPQKLAKKQSQPYLILNGERDYQVSPEEAKKWKNGSKHKKSKTIIYPKLNHMFFSGEGVLIPSEYEKEGHLHEQTLKDIINWSNSL